MNIIPDVVGFPLEKAMNLFNHLELEVSIKKTQSPKMLEKTGECRVIKQKKVEKHIELTISYF